MVSYSVYEWYNNFNNQVNMSHVAVHVWNMWPYFVSLSNMGKASKNYRFICSKETIGSKMFIWHSMLKKSCLNNEPLSSRPEIYECTDHFGAKNKI